MLVDKAHTKLSLKYLDYTDVFLLDLAVLLPENTSMNKYAIELMEDKQSFYGSIYTLKLVELEILKIYIEIYLKTEFI